MLNSMKWTKRMAVADPKCGGVSRYTWYLCRSAVGLGIHFGIVALQALHILAASLVNLCVAPDILMEYEANSMEVEHRA